MDGESVCNIAQTYAFAVKNSQKQDYREKRFITQKELEQWFSEKSEYGASIRRFFAANTTVVQTIIEALQTICQKPVSFSRTIVYSELTSTIQ